MLNKHKCTPLTNGGSILSHACYSFTSEPCSTVLCTPKAELPHSSMYFCTGKKANKWREVSHFLSVFQIYALKYIIHHKRLLVFSFLAVMEKAHVMPLSETGCKVCLNDVTGSTHLHFPVIISIRSVHLTALF